MLMIISTLNSIAQKQKAAGLFIRYQSELIYEKINTILCVLGKPDPGIRFVCNLCAEALTGRRAIGKKFIRSRNALSTAIAYATSSVREPTPTKQLNRKAHISGFKNKDKYQEKRWWFIRTPFEHFRWINKGRRVGGKKTFRYSLRRAITSI